MIKSIPLKDFFPLLILCFLLGGCSLLAENSFTEDSADDPPSVLTKEKWIDSEGWTEFTPSEDCRILYISETGSDETGTVYARDDSEIGSDPLEPEGTVLPFATYEAACEEAREGYGDWILFKRGESFTATLEPLSGESSDYPALIGAYGTTGDMPLISPVNSDDEDTDRVEYESCIYLFCRRGRDCINSVVTSLDFYCSDKDPDVGTPIDVSSSGLGLMALGSGSEGGTIRNLLIEGCRFRYFDGNTIQKLDEGVVENVVIKRCQFLNNYTYTTDNGHCQGLYASYIDGLYFIENLFDHNGWLNQASDDEVIGGGTIFNHNTYLTDCTNVEYYRNVSLRPSSIHFKFTAQNGEASATNIELRENLLVDGEVGISLGGNDQSPYRFKDILIEGNLVTEQGRSRPTNRYIGWGIDVVDWDGGMVVNNLIAHFYDQGDNNNNYGFSFNGGFRDVQFKNNTVWNVYGNGILLYDRDSSYREDNWFYSNRLEADDPDKSWVQVVKIYDGEGVVFAQNSYRSDTNETPFLWDEDYLTFDQWSDISDDALSEMVSDDFLTEGKNIAAYNSSLGGEESIDAFIEGCREQNRYDWNTLYTAEAVIEWFQE
ncbi:MAG: right-handed parallel beta-helix repeat-containing protein [Spirochaetales bacterium]|nr:right-handed parallel beta-helix repeat-containing protein [Spirochaetales bacterium]